jgi:L-cysteine desulfidase
MKSEMLLKILKENTFITVGCTDPVAVGLAAAIAYKAIDGEVEDLQISLDKNIYKNALSVGIPGTMRKGLDLAVALCLVAGDSEDGLSILKNVDKKDIVKAEVFLKKHRISFVLNEDAESIFIEAVIRTSNGTASALLLNSHDNLAEITVNGNVTYSRIENAEKSDPLKSLARLKALTIMDILNFVGDISPSKLCFLNEGIEMNLQAAESGESSRVGLGVGSLYREMIEKGLLHEDLIHRVKQKVGAAGDARMSGMNVPIFGCFGSGNHGITLFTTMGMMAKELGAEKDTISRSLAVALLVTGIIKSRTGILTPHCGCSVAAGTGAAAGMVYLMGGKEKEIQRAVHLMLADLTGMLCDGAKYGCSLKLATSAGVALEISYMAMMGAEVPGDNGIVGVSLQKTMDNLETLTKKGMAGVDRSVLDILLNS